MKLGIFGAIAAVIILFIVSCQSDESIEFKRYYSSGALVYQSHCQNCHGVKGEGLSALIPPLTDSIYLKNNKNALACYITSGLKGQIIIKGKTFDDAMPANDLSPLEVAQVSTYIGNSFGNKLNTINEQEVQADLAKCR
ncbi:MAG: cytochrome c [Mucilaginibacter sp.]|nr:cytochrome c [Mucilaginibacter sp.]